MDDATAERLLRGSAPADRPELEPLGLLLSQVRDLAQADPTPTPALQALLRDGFQPQPGVVPAPRTAPSALRRRLATVAGLSLGLKVLTGTGVALAGVTAAAGAGVLPEAVQERVADVVRAVTPFELEDRAPVAPAEQRETGPQGPDGNGPAYGDPTLPDVAPMDAPPRTTPPQQPAVPAPAPREDAPQAPADRAPEQRPAPAPQERPGASDPAASDPAGDPAAGDPAPRPGPADEPAGPATEPAAARTTAAAR